MKGYTTTKRDVEGGEETCHCKTKKKKVFKAKRNYSTPYETSQKKYLAQEKKRLRQINATDKKRQKEMVKTNKIAMKKNSTGPVKKKFQLSDYYLNPKSSSKAPKSKSSSKRYNKSNYIEDKHEVNPQEQARIRQMIRDQMHKRVKGGSAIPPNPFWDRRDNVTMRKKKSKGVLGTAAFLPPPLTSQNITIKNGKKRIQPTVI